MQKKLEAVYSSLRFGSCDYLFCSLMSEGKLRSMHYLQLPWHSVLLVFQKTSSKLVLTDSSWFLDLWRRNLQHRYRELWGTHLVFCFCLLTETSAGVKCPSPGSRKKSNHFYWEYSLMIHCCGFPKMEHSSSLVTHWNTANKLTGPLLRCFLELDNIMQYVQEAKP